MLVYGGVTMKYKVIFTFDKDNTKSFILESETREHLFQDIRTQKVWYTHTDDNGVNHLIKMDNVTSISIMEHSERPIQII
jgi:hypothetical protein